MDEFAKGNNIADDYLKKLKESDLTKTEDKKVAGCVEKSRMKMEQMPLPKFYGEARFYHRFKRDFEELVLPHLENREAVFTLRQCLSKNVEYFVGSGDYDVNEVFKHD